MGNSLSVDLYVDNESDTGGRVPSGHSTAAGNLPAFLSLVRLNYDASRR